MNLNLTIPRPSTLLLVGLLLALFTTTPVPLAVLVAAFVWLIHTPAALVVGVALTLVWRAMNPKAVR